jgi:isocitrate dehydrogenase (NAD+)
MLRSLGLPRFADVIDTALTQVLAEKKIRTPDIGGTNTSFEFTEAICERLTHVVEKKKS